MTLFYDVVSDVSYAGSAMGGEILGQERRRFWHDEDKLEIITSIGVGGATVPRWRNATRLHDNRFTLGGMS
ncbi:hypothetical protein [Ruegeria halocynthiae]|uniref:hypothetical protein n=1 Tax=Ruegeria halocynthiae TaxID=985054 RepID=UPI0009DEFB25|nr:hypothetical protein [Ruegeria halocynthiae]